jgi:3-deoxy-D-arabino-heptulosonate 7-phosphate (DAHP) synthase
MFWKKEPKLCSKNTFRDFLNAASYALTTGKKQIFLCGTANIYFNQRHI